MSLKELSRCLHGRVETPGDAFQPESGHAFRTRRRGKGNRLPKKIGEYKLLGPQKRTAALSEKDPGVLEATKSLVSASSNTCVVDSEVGNMHSGFVEIGSRREEWEDVLISVRSEKDLDCETAWTSRWLLHFRRIGRDVCRKYRTHSTAHQPTVITSIKKKPDSKPTFILAGMVPHR